jgi:uridylate kinase
MAKKRYARVLVKVSGEALMGEQPFGLDAKTLTRIGNDLAKARKAGTEIAVVVGGGNILRGAELATPGMNRATADQMGMLATVINALALERAIEAAGAPARAFSALDMPTVCQPYARQPAIKDLSEGRIVVLAGGTGNPYFTTDTAASLRAAELTCQAIFKATDVDGVYDSDPDKNPKAKRFKTLTHTDALAKNLKVMDAAAFALARDAKLPIIVFSIRGTGSISAAIADPSRGTIVTP